MTPFAREPGVRYIVRGGDLLYSVGGVPPAPVAPLARRIAGALGPASSAARRQAARVMEEAE